MASTGQLSIKELARQHGLSDTAIRKCAKANGDPGPLGRCVEPGLRKFGSQGGVRANLLTVTPSEAAIVDAAGGMREANLATRPSSMKRPLSGSR
jgi:hypothetical protein